MITDPINITINNTYNLCKWEKEIIYKCIDDNPSFTNDELAENLGISVRTLFRKSKEYGVNLRHRPNFNSMNIKNFY